MRIRPQDERRLLEYGYGITAAVRRSTKRAGEVSMEEFKHARSEFENRIPNPSGLNRGFALAALVDAYSEFRTALRR